MLNLTTYFFTQPTPSYEIIIIIIIIIIMVYSI